jgi:hypothetical protein
MNRATSLFFLVLTIALAAACGDDPCDELADACSACDETAIEHAGAVFLCTAAEAADDADACEDLIESTRDTCE